MQELRRLYGIENSSDNGTYVRKYEKFLNEKAKNRSFYSEKNTKCLKWRDLTGPEKIRLFKIINILPLFPNIKDASKVQFIWAELMELYNILRCTKLLTHTDIHDLTTRVKTWLSVFLYVYQTKHVIPYTHIFVNHAPEFLNLCRSLSPFSQQGLEKLNDNITENCEN